MSRRLFWIAVVVGLTLLTPEARAQSSPRWRNCTGNPDVDLDQEISELLGADPVQPGKEALPCRRPQRPGHRIRHKGRP